MAASSSSAPFFGIREEEQNQQMNQQQSSTPTSSSAQAPPPQKKKRNQPGTPSKYHQFYLKIDLPSYISNKMIFSIYISLNLLHFFPSSFMLLSQKSN
jgi:hypothetical protein